MIESPENEVPPGTVPQSAKRKCGQSVQEAAKIAMPASAQGNMDVITNPGAQRDVPAVPELADICGQVGPEVCGNGNSHHSSESNRDVTISAEIEKNSEGDGGKEHPTVRQRERCKAILRMIKPVRLSAQTFFDTPKRRLEQTRHDIPWAQRSPRLRATKVEIVCSA